ncbi:hypothetical protein V6N11_071334 [Hibiscus sabdariffa]|uniref:Reverse transcriptase zinc-binding domain-containing protein n=1 Tax=Hibiscus sabdariffa TaxID=183260 RepID=A0ABR2U0D5_9ROSI
MVSSDGDWNWNLFSCYFSQDVLEHIASIKPHASMSLSDSPGWLWNGGRDFSVKSAYDVRAHSYSSSGDGLWKIIHKFRGLERVKPCLWLVCRGCVLPNGERVRRHITSSATCVACEAIKEDPDHLLWQCYEAKLFRNRRTFDLNNEPSDTVMGSSQRLRDVTRRALDRHGQQ